MHKDRLDDLTPSPLEDGSAALRAQGTDEHSEYNKDVARMRRARKAYVEKLIAFDEKWCPDVVGKRKSSGFYNIP